jgi:type I restriction enzyme M protein
MTLDDKRTPIEANDLPDVLARWRSLSAPTPVVERAQPSVVERAQRDETPAFDEHARPRTAQSFLVPRQEIVDNGYDLSLNRDKEIEVEEVEHRSPLDILDDLDALEIEIQNGLKRLREMLA